MVNINFYTIKVRLVASNNNTSGKFNTFAPSWTDEFRVGGMALTSSRMYYFSREV
jgi:hypothetical protein